MITKKCDECGRGFEVDEAKRNWQHVLVCSDECRRTRAARTKREKYVKQEWPQEKQCEWCGGKFLVHGPGGKPRQYCNRECYLAKKSNECHRQVQEQKEKKICLSCGEAFVPVKFSGNRQKYCSKTCFRREMWEKHGKPRQSGYAFMRIRKHILEEYDKTCQLCGSKKNPQVHHLDSSRDESGMNNEFDNLTVLCRNCHYAIHRVSVVKTGNDWGVSGKIFEILGLKGSIKII